MTKHHTPTRRRKLAPIDDRVVKRAVSLPHLLDAQVTKLASSTQATFSGLVREALELYLKRAEDERIEKEYIDYYADPKMKKETAELVEYWHRASQEAWLSKERKGG